MTDRQLVTMEDPTFEPGSTHTAKVLVTVFPAGIDCTIELFLSIDGVKRIVSSDIVPFTSTGAQQTASLDIIMPATSPVGGYAVCLDIMSEGVLIAGFCASENIYITSPLVGIVIDSISVIPSQIALGETAIATMVCTNHSSTAGSKDIVLRVWHGSGGVSKSQNFTFNAGETKSIRVMEDMGLGGAAGNFTLYADDKSCSLVVVGNCSLTGVVISADTGLPLSGVIVSAFDAPEWTQITDVNGRFTIAGLTFSSCYLDMKYPNYVEARISVTNLINGVTKDIGQIKLSLVSAIQFISIAMPTKSPIFLNEQIYAGFRVKNISSQPAYAQLGFNQNAGSWNTQLLLQPGQISDWYGTPYPVVWSSHHTGAYHLYASVNGVVVGECDVTVLEQSASLKFWSAPYSNWSTNLSVPLEIHNDGDVSLAMTVRTVVTKPDGTKPTNSFNITLAVGEVFKYEVWFNAGANQNGTYLIDAYLDWGGVQGQRHISTTMIVEGITGPANYNLTVTSYVQGLTINVSGIPGVATIRVTGSQVISIPYGTTVSVSATPSSLFGHWVYDGVTKAWTYSSIYITMSADHTIAVVV